jgi:hypothetical protein
MFRELIHLWPIFYRTEDCSSRIGSATVTIHKVIRPRVLQPIYRSTGPGDVLSWMLLLSSVILDVLFWMLQTI